MNIALAQSMTKIKRMKVVLANTSVDVGEMDGQLEQLRTKLMEIDNLMNGSKAKREVGEKFKPVIMDRLFAVSRGVDRSTYGPTKSHRDNLEIANDLIGKTHEQLSSAMEELSTAKRCRRSSRLFVGHGRQKTMAPNKPVPNYKNESKLNHLVFWPPFLLLIGAAILNFALPDQFAKITNGANEWVLTNFGWLFTVVAFLAVMLSVYILFSPMAKVRLGGPDAKPLMHMWNWFAITVCTTIAVGILLWATAEPSCRFVCHVDDVPALDIYTVCHLRRRIADVCVFLLQHEKAIQPRFTINAAAWRSTHQQDR